MATYNGERFISDQIKSILHQMNDCDELVVVDDFSTDSSNLVISSFLDKRIKHYKNKKNMGHIKSFEQAISLASGDIIILSDQDDLWTDCKIRNIMTIFNSNKSIVLVHHELSTITERGEILSKTHRHLPSGVQSFFSFSLRNLFKPEVFGCAIAFRRELVDRILPFPSAVYAHDHWISIVASVFGKIFYLNKSLTLYRQHSNNVTPKKGLSFLKKTIVRLKYLYLYGLAFYREYS